ncbi:uncharacterized protein LOC129134628 isoform X2 [Agelaius phoeniceus]|uniref:uncharacterized protein LOC129134628 isoform X2 n=1 Tax=Agelaius phoeniceus TaxID=39638 RepID=UPI0040553183
MPRGMEQYIVLGRIGEGAHGVVFKAKHRETGELVALKKVPLRRPEEGLPPQTLREIKALREMEAHPHVIRLRAAFAQGPAVVLALELLVGDLGGLLRAAPAPLPPARVRALLAMTLRGLGHVHGQHLVHRGRGLHFRGAADAVAAVPGGERHRAAVLCAAGPGHAQPPGLAGAVRAARFPQALVLPMGLYWPALVHTGPYWFIVDCTGFCWSILVLAGPYWSLLVHTGPYWSIVVAVPQELLQVQDFPKLQFRPRVRTGPYWSILAHTGLCWPILVYTGPQWSVLVHTGSRPPRSCRISPSCGSAHGPVLAHDGLYWFMPVYTGLYRSILVHAGLYWSMQVYTGPYWFILVHTGLYWFV